MADTPILALTELVSSQAIPEEVVNENTRWLEFFAAGGRITDRDDTAPPVSPVDGEAYLVKATGTGAWAGHDGDIALYISNAWAFKEAVVGMMLYVIDEAAAIVFNGTTWDVLSTGGTITAANASEVNTGTNTTKFVNPDALAGSNFGIKTVEVLLADPGGSAVTTGDGIAFFRVPPDMNGMNLIACGAVLDTAGTGGGYLMQLRRKRSGSDVDMLSTRISIDSGENDSADAATPPAINTSNDDIATGDRIYFDRDGVPTGGKGDAVWMQFQLP